MTKQKKHLTNKPITGNNRLKKRDKDSQEPLAPTTKPVQTKRKVNDLSFFLKKEQSISPPTIEKKFNLLYFLKSTSIQGLALECPNLQKAIQKIKSKISIQRNLLYGVLQRYFQTSKHVMWSDKYKPRNLKQSLHSKTGEKIKIWLRSFYYYRNTVLEQSNSFIDNYFCQNSNTQLKNMREFNWKLKGLVVKGRRGVGKTSTILATAKQIAYQIYNCGNQCNQIKYLKQKNEATQSQCVKTKINKNQSLIQKTNQRITKFAIRNEQNQMETQAKKIQFMHNVNNFYPEEDEIKFYNELKKTIESSKIPFLMTLTGSHLPQSLQIYDVIDFQEANNEEIGALFSLIYHIEKSFQRCIDLQTTVEKERFKQVLNDQLESFQFEILTSFSDFIRLTQTFNKKFVSLLSFIQISKRINTPLNIEEAQRALKLYLNRSDPYDLLADYFSLQSQNSIEQDSTKQLSFQMSKYLVQDDKQEQLVVSHNNKLQFYDDQMKKQQISGEMPTFICTPNKEEEKVGEEYFAKTKTSKKTSEIQQNQRTLSDIVKQLDMKVIQDLKPQVLKDEFMIFNKLCNSSSYKLCDSSSQQLEDSLMHKIPINSHVKIRKQILHHAKHQFHRQSQMVTSLKEKQINFIGFLIDSRSRVSRKKNFKDDLNLKKLLKNEEINYLKNFTQFLKPGSMQTKFRNI